MKKTESEIALTQLPNIKKFVDSLLKVDDNISLVVKDYYKAQEENSQLKSKIIDLLKTNTQLAKTNVELLCKLNLLKSTNENN